MGYQVSIVIPNFNGEDIIIDCIESCYRALNTPLIEDFEIIISDDNSVDNSIDFISNKFPEVKVVVNPNKRGFSKNANYGISCAKFNIVLLLNNDITLGEGYFDSQLPLFDKPEVFGTMGTIEDKSDLSLGTRELEVKSFMIQNRKDSLIDNKRIYSFYLSGANCLLKKNVFEKIGGFNEMFNPYYYEDTELGLKAWNAGYQCLHIEDAKCSHLGSKTINNENLKFRKQITKRNKLILSYTFLNQSSRIWFLRLTILKLLFKVIVFDRSYSRAIWEFLKVKDKIDQYRRDLGIKMNIKEISEVILELNTQGI